MARHSKTGIGFVLLPSTPVKSPSETGFIRGNALSKRRRITPSVHPRGFQRVHVAITATSADSTPQQNFMRKDLKKRENDQARKVSVVGLIFLMITYLWSIILFIPMAIAHPFVLWRDRATRRFHDFIAMAWMRCSLGTVRVSPSIINAHNLPPKDVACVFVANHTSYLDIYSFAYLNRRIKYVSKAEIFKIPIVGWAMQMAGNIALHRMNRRGQMEAYRKMVAVVKNGLSLVVFPEGTRSASGRLRHFKTGAFRAAKQQDAPVIPVTILGTREVMPSHAWVPLRYPSKPITLVIHQALDSKKYTIEELRDQAYRAIDSGLPPDVQSNQTQKKR